MKFTWFNLMPWPHLPDDFRARRHSVWVDNDSKLFDPALANVMHHEYMEQLEYAEELGFDGIGVSDHHQNGYGLMPSPNLPAYPERWQVFVPHAELKIIDGSGHMVPYEEPEALAALTASFLDRSLPPKG